MKVYEYKNCGTCKKALKFLKENNISFKSLPIRETPPSKKEFESMLKAYEGDIKKLFNTSGMDYRSMGLKDKMDGMTKARAFTLLSSNGNLVKRPFLVSKDLNLVGFKEEEWQQLL